MHLFSRGRMQAEAVRSEREAKELEGASFQPAVTELARALWGEGNLGRNPVWQRLSNVNKAKMLERIEGMRKMREDQEVRGVGEHCLLPCCCRAGAAVDEGCEASGRWFAGTQQ